MTGLIQGANSLFIGHTDMTDYIMQADVMTDEPTRNPCGLIHQRSLFCFG